MTTRIRKIHRETSLSTTRNKKTIGQKRRRIDSYSEERRERQEAFHNNNNNNNKRKNWIKLDQFDAEDAQDKLLDYQIEENVVLLNFKTKKNKKDFQSHYRCKGDDGTCPFQVKLSEAQETITMYQSGDHSHDTDEIEKTNHGINPLFKQKVDQYIVDSFSNFRIRQKLETDGYDENLLPTGRQLSNRRSYLSKKILGELANNSEAGFFTWMEEKGKIFSKAGPNDLLILSHELSEENFMLLVSTKSLLKNALLESRDAEGFLALDTTHKLISCQFKFSTFMTATINREAADIAYLIQSNENAATFVFALQEIKNYIKKNLKFNWQVKFTMSDFSDAIANSLKKVFPEAVRAKCLYHLKSNLIKRYTKPKYSFLQDYIEAMAVCFTSCEINFVWQLVKKEITKNKELKDISKDFIQYFEKTYMTSENRSFYVGVLPPGYSNTNNLLEGHHRHIKNNIFNYEVRSISKFLDFLPAAVKDLSRTRTRKAFPIAPTLNDRYIWEKGQKIKKYIHPFKEYMLFTNQSFVNQGIGGVTTKLIQDFFGAYTESNTWKNFQNRLVFYCYDTQRRECDCKDFARLAFCKHSIASEIHLGELQVPLKYSIKTVEMFKSKTNKKKVSKALVIDK